MLRLEPGLCFLAALMLLALPLPWVAAAVTAAAFHELGHWTAVKLMGGELMGLRLGASGAVLDVRVSGRLAEALCILAGPLASLSLMLLSGRLPRLALCGLVQGCFNLLPMGKLDGGRLLGCLVGESLRSRAERWTWAIGTLGIGAAVWALGITPLVLVGWFMLGFRNQSRKL